MSTFENAPVLIGGVKYRAVTEGQAQILAPYQTSSAAKSTPGRNNDEGNQAVFYNPIQQYNRDLSVLAILTYGEGAIAEKSLKRQKRPARKKRKLDHVNGDVEPEINDKKRTAEHAELDDADVSEKRVRLDESDLCAELADEDLLQAPITTSTVVNTQNGVAERTAQTQNQQPKGQSDDKKSKQPPFSILDALSASGLRAVRYAKEIPFATAVIANDFLPDAVKAIDLNIEHNGLTGKVYSNQGDARQYMYSKCGNERLDGAPGYVHRFDVIDLDPYGTAAPFLDSALQALADGGLICVTCTDTGVWACNGYPEKAYALYGGIPLKGSHSHEAGLRLILHAIATTAAKYGIAIEPLLSLSIDFYGRLFIRIHKSQQAVKMLSGSEMMIYNCDQGCGAWSSQLIARNSEKPAKNGEMFFKHGFAQGPTTEADCEHCGTRTHIGGPMWAGPLHNPIFVQKILDKLPHLDKSIYGTTERVRGMLTVALEEENLHWPPKATGVEVDANVAQPGRSALIPRMPPQLLSPSPLFFQPTYLSKVLSLPTPSDDALRSAVLSLGYTCTRSHCKPGSFKTNAPWKVIWEVMREYARQLHPERIDRLLGKGEYIGKESVRKNSPGWNILKRLRNRDDRALEVSRLREDLRNRLNIGNKSSIETTSDLETLLKGVLYVLEHPSATANNPNDNAEATPAKSTKTNGVEASPLQGEKPHKISGKACIDAGSDVSELVISFDESVVQRAEKGQKIVRYQVNPRANWGPMVKAKGS